MRVPDWRLGLHRLQVLFGLLGRKAEQVLRQQSFFLRRLYRLLLFCYENFPQEGRNDAASPEGRLTDSISCWFRRSRAGHQVPSLVLSGVLGNHVFFCPY